MFNNYEYLNLLDEYIIIYKKEILTPLIDDFNKYHNGDENKRYWELIKYFNQINKELELYPY